MRISVRVPATSANLGPGFDCFGLALDLVNEVMLDTDAEPGVSWEGEGAEELPTDGTDMVSRAIAHTIELQGRIHPGADVPAFHLHGLNRIPLEKGLGSSSSAAVAGVALARTLLGPSGFDDPYATFAYASELEGHPDNAAPATYGGLTVFAAGSGYVHRLDPHPSLDPVVLVPERLRLPTAEARSALASTVDRRDAVFNIGHAALAAVALIEGDLDLLLVALHDRLHERVRGAMVPEMAALLDDLRHRQIPACLSGAGPSILAFERDGHVAGDPPEGWRALRPGVRAQGVEVVVQG
ncbi:MAG TPA: homoserine kinase [Actinomycetota bacterium]